MFFGIFSGKSNTSQDKKFHGVSSKVSKAFGLNLFKNDFSLHTEFMPPVQWNSLFFVSFPKLILIVRI